MVSSSVSSLRDLSYVLISECAEKLGISAAEIHHVVMGGYVSYQVDEYLRTCVRPDEVLRVMAEQARRLLGEGPRD